MWRATFTDGHLESLGKVLSGPHRHVIPDFTRYLRSMSTDPDSRVGFGPYLPGVGPVFSDADSNERLIRYGVIEDLERALEIHGKDTAAFLVEPIQGEAGYGSVWHTLIFILLTLPSFRIVVPPAGYLQKVRELCTKYNVLLICDEIQTVSFYCAAEPELITQRALVHRGYAEPVNCLLVITTTSVRISFYLERLFLVAVSNSCNIFPSVSQSDTLPPVYPVSAVLADKDVMLCIRPGEHGSTYGG